MHFLLHAKIKKPRDVSNQEFFGVWQREATASRELAKQGVPIFKVAGKYEVMLIVEVGSATELDEAIHALPLWQEGFQDMVDIDAIALRPYTEWADHLDKLAAG